MVYKIDDKYYIKVGSYLVEVLINVDGDNVDVKPLDDKIEIDGSINTKVVSLKELKKEAASKKEVEEKIVNKKEDDFIEEHTYFKNSSKYKK